jgi:hypothetical protein
MTAATGTVWARGVREPANDPLSAAVPLGAAALFGGHCADQAAYAVVNAGLCLVLNPIQYQTYSQELITNFAG